MKGVILLFSGRSGGGDGISGGWNGEWRGVSGEELVGGGMVSGEELVERS